MEREADDRVDLLEGDHIDRHIRWETLLDMGHIPVCRQDGYQREPAGQQALDQLLSLDHELAQPAGQIRGLERAVDGDPWVVEIGDQLTSHRLNHSLTMHQS